MAESALPLLLLVLCPLTLSCGSRRDTMEASPVPSLLKEVKGQDMTTLTQCNQDGVTKCTAVTSDLETLRNLKKGDQLTLLQGLDITMEVSSPPSLTSSGGLSLHLSLRSGGEATITLGATGSMYGNIQPHSGDHIYAIEATKEEFNVLLERPSGYFNQFED